MPESFWIIFKNSIYPSQETFCLPIVKIKQILVFGVLINVILIITTKSKYTFLESSKTRLCQRMRYVQDVNQNFTDWPHGALCATRWRWVDFLIHSKLVWQVSLNRNIVFLWNSCLKYFVLNALRDAVTQKQQASRTINLHHFFLTLKEIILSPMKFLIKPSVMTPRVWVPRTPISRGWGIQD